MSAIAFAPRPLAVAATSFSSAPASPGRSFSYERASPSLRWPDKDASSTDASLSTRRDGGLVTPSPGIQDVSEQDGHGDEESGFVFTEDYMRNSRLDGKRYRSRKAVARLEAPSTRVMSKIALIKAKDWKSRVARLTDAILALDAAVFVADILDAWTEQLHPTDLCFVVKIVGQTNWQRALEVYEWLNLRRWYSPNTRMLATIIGVLGRAKQVTLADELYERAQPEIGDCVQVYNSIMSAHARQGGWQRVEHIFRQMQQSHVQPDLITFNIRANAQTKAGLQRGHAVHLLHDIRAAGLRPDIVTYNTLISACTNNSCWEDALEVFREMRQHKCDPDIWTYNALITVFGRAGMVDLAEEYYQSMQASGLLPDAVTYNAMLSAFARSGRVEDVDDIRVQMWKARCNEDEITFNTLMHMYGKLGLPDKAVEVFDEMKARQCRPDAVTFSILIDVLGKAGLIADAERVFQEMGEAQIWPTLQTFTALICAYAKAGLLGHAERTYDSMSKSGIVADELANSVMVDVFYRAGLSWRAISAYQNLLSLGVRPALHTCSIMLSVYAKEGMQQELRELMGKMQQLGFEAASLCSSFAKAGLWEAASSALELCIKHGQPIDRDTMGLVLDSYASESKFDEACSFVHSVSTSGLQPEGTWLREALILMLARTEKLGKAMIEFNRFVDDGHKATTAMYRALIVSSEKADMPDEAVQLFESMLSAEVEPDERCCKSAIQSYCNLGLPNRAYELQGKSRPTFEGLGDSSVYVTIIEAFGKQQRWEAAEKCFNELHKDNLRICTKALNALLFAYAESGQYDRLRKTFNSMTAQGVTTSDISSSAVLNALTPDGVSEEPHEQADDLEQEFQVVEQLGFVPNRRTFLVMLSALSKEGNVLEAKKVYLDMKQAGFVPQQQVYAILVGLFAKVGSVEDAESILKEMEEAGCTPDVFVNNAMIGLYGKLGDYKKASVVFKNMLISDCTPDLVTYNTLIHLYSRHQMVTEAYIVFQELLKAGFKPDVTTYTTLITGYGSALMWEACESLFKEMQEVGCPPNVTTYHALINAYRRVGMHEAAEKTMKEMEEAGFEPTVTALHMLMDSYGKGGEPERADELMEKLRTTGIAPTELQYTALIDAYLKEDNYELAVKRLKDMKASGLSPNFVTFTCVVGAASRCERRIDMLMLLAALRDVGFSIPFRLLTEKDNILTDVEELFLQLRNLGPAAGQGVVNVLQDLLWAFQKRATAIQIHLLAVKTRIYPDDLTQVDSGKWGGDLRRLSAGAGLVVLSMWLTRMQEASLIGSPESSKAVMLVIGRNRNSNRVSLSKTLKAHLWEMGSPFLVSKTREGILIAKGHSLRNWLRDSPLCMDLQLKDEPIVPAVNSMQMFNGAWMKREMVPILQQIEASMGELRPKKFSRLAHMDDDKRTTFIALDLEHHAEKIERDKRRGGPPRKVLKRAKRLFSKPKAGPRLLSPQSRNEVFPGPQKFSGNGSESS